MSTETLEVTVEQVAANVPLPENLDCIYLSGSMIAGFSHATSDLDVFVVASATPTVAPSAVKRDVSVEPAAIPVVAATVDGVSWDVEYWTTDQVAQLLEKCRTTDGPVVGSLTLADADFLYRLSIGRPVEGEQWLESAQRELAESHFVRILVWNYLDAADGRLDDVIGLLASGDIDSAAIAVREAFDSVVDALLAEAGELYPSTKWRTRKYKRAQPRLMDWDEYWERETMRRFDPAKAEPWVVDMAERTRELMMDVGRG